MPDDSTMTEEDIFRTIPRLVELYFNLSQSEELKPAATHIAMQINTLCQSLSYEE